MATTASWSQSMYQTISSNDVDYVAYSLNNTPSIANFWKVFFIVYMIIGAFFFLNLFVGVVISSFNMENQRIGGLDQLTER